MRSIKCLPVLLLLLPASLFSQYKVTIILDSIPAKTTADAIYITGNFNNWQPADPNTILSKNDKGKFEKVFDGVEGGTYEYLFTLGSDESKECKKDGSKMDNRTLVVTSDTVVHLSVAAWKNAAKSISATDRSGIPVISAQPYIAVAGQLLHRKFFTAYGSIQRQTI